MRTINLIIPLLILAGCASTKEEIEIRDAEIQSGTWLVYEGILPCADCSGIKTKLEIFIDYNNAEPPFILHQSYLGGKDSGKTFTKNGMYGTLKETFRNEDATAYELNPYKPDERMYFLRVHNDTLMMLDNNVQEIKSDLNYNLLRTGTIREK